MKSESEVTQLCPTLSDTMDYSLPGSSVPGILQARTLEWGAIAFSEFPHQSTIKKIKSPQGAEAYFYIDSLFFTELCLPF